MKISCEQRRPKIVCLSGSTRFIETMAVCAWNLEKQGIITLGCILLPSWYGAEAHHQAEKEGVAEILDALHFHKIEIADELFVANAGGYIGEQTRKEIEYAKSLRKPVSYLSERFSEEVKNGY